MEGGKESVRKIGKDEKRVRGRWEGES
jgi:hypothetical protein